VTSYRCEFAWLPDGGVGRDVIIEVEDGRIVEVRTGPDAGSAVRGNGEVEHLRGLVLPGAANVHSHAFHRALRGRTHGRLGTFWSWRERMYEVAAQLDPAGYRTLARASYAEMALAGFTAVGEFHYLHHQPDGTPYVDRNAMGDALIEAARQAGLRITLLDTCYLAGGFGAELDGVQRRFGDGDAARWAARVEDLYRRHAAADDVVIGAAIHSVRAVPAAEIPVVAAWAHARGTPLHVHVSEQPSENAACSDTHGCSPTALLMRSGALGARTTAVHATHLDDRDIRALAASGTRVCLCPTTERDLGDGVGPAHHLVGAGVPIAVGTDSHAIVDAFEEVRAVELGLRLETWERGHLPVDTLLTALTANGHACLGTPDAGRLELGCRADLVAVDLLSVRTAGGSNVEDAAAAVVFGATAADVTDVIVDGHRIVRDRAHRLGDVGALLTHAITAASP
jgi:formiminoglutamate deiminase